MNSRRLAATPALLYQRWLIRLALFAIAFHICGLAAKAAVTTPLDVTKLPPAATHPVFLVTARKSKKGSIVSIPNQPQLKAAQITPPPSNRGTVPEAR